MSDPLTVAEPAGGWREPWPRAFELAAELPGDRWALVGGLMVQAHAMAHGIDTARVTRDVDAAVRIEAGVYSYTAAVAALHTLGYAVDDSTRFTYRFMRGSDEVDLMVADHERPPPRHSRREVMAVTGGKQALSRIHDIHFEVGNSEVSIPVPTLHGALVLKAAAYIVDPRDRERHIEDAMTLLACIVDIEPIITDLRGSDRKRIMHLLRAIDSQPLIAARVPSDTFRLAQRTIEEFRAALNFSG